MGKLLAHALLGKLVEAIKLLPELLLNGHGGKHGELDLVELELIEHLKGSLVASITFQVSEFARLGKNKQTESGVVGHADKVGEVLSIFGTDGSIIDSLRELKLEDVLTVMLPNTLEVGLV